MTESKDELAGRFNAVIWEKHKEFLGKFSFDVAGDCVNTMAKDYADEARKYMREMVKAIETSDWATAEYLKKELLARLKESK